MTEEPRLIRPRRPGDDPAFPIVADTLIHQTGMSKREHYAALFAAGLFANPKYEDKSLYTLVDWAIDASDRLIEMTKVDREDF